ncbi:MmcQ/YjbR family DNA-binding protein [Deinococcus budaensis]|uniref:Putative DNA-binding protein (MmcQ/YjbR family) n=1 Tax=Deinococcus budaensis TaxID=1665626 RepID=A0A7W8LQ72_9DEIO|nr:MmcQ/YjbR family DNA-binding protein [Deinococcus budaensis]MBB5234543.1 putative DNA-binding protein (MmcQ/YjbR family) [Deinococcus budaensis]
MRLVTDVRRACALLPGSRETFPFDATTLVFKVAGKMYALTDLTADPPTLSLKVRPGDGEALRAAYPGVRPGYHLDKRHWVTVTLNGTVPQRVVGELLKGSYALVVAGLTRAQRAELEG